MRTRFVLLFACAACAKSISGPTPTVTGALGERDQSTAPAYVCNAQVDPAVDGWLVDALGDHFAPIPTNTLGGTPGVQMPAVELDGAAEKYVVPPAYVRFHDRTRMPLALRTADSAKDAHTLPAGDYDLKVTNLNGASATKAAAVRVVPPPDITAVALSANGGSGTFLCADQTQTLTVTGTGFRTDKNPTVTIGAHSFTGASTGTSVTVTIPAGTFAAGETSPAGTVYTVHVTNPEGCTAPFGSAPVAAAQVTAFPSCTVLGTLSVRPRFGYQLADTPVTITDAFNKPATQPFSGALPKVYITAPLASGGPAQQIPLRSIAFVDQHTITASVPVCSGVSFGAPTGTLATCPGIAPGGPYDLQVIDPISGTGSIPAAFTVVANPPPAITGLSPASITTVGGAVTVSGSNFDATSTVLIGNQVTGGVEYCPLAVTSRTGATAIAVTVPSSVGPANCYVEDAAGNQTPATANIGLSIGQYLIRVQHGGDVSNVDFAALVVTSTSFNPVDAGTAASQLVTGRGAAGAVVAFDDNGNPFLYVAGGSTTGRDQLASIEVAPIGLFGNLGGDCSGATCTFRELKSTPLPTARSGVQLVARRIPATGAGTSYVYAIGGRASGGALGEIWRAQVLRNQDAPSMRQITVADGVAGPGAGAWYYKIAAVFPSGDPLNKNGAESLPSDEESVTLGSIQQPTVKWGCVGGASKYRVYRLQRSVDQNTGVVTTTEVLLAEPAAACVAGLMTFTDTGAAPLDATKQSLPRGALGAWVDVGKSLNTARFDFQAKVLPGTNSSIAVVGGCTSASGPGCGASDNSIEAIAFAAATDLDPSAVTTVGSGLTGRDRFGMALATAGTADVAAGKSFLLVFGGETNGTEISGNSTVQGADIADMVFADLTGAPQNIGVGGWADIISNLGFSEATRTNNQSLFSKSGSLGTPAGGFSTTGDFNLNLNAGVPPYAVGGTRFLPGEQFFRAYFYIVGGFPSAATSGTPTVYGAPTRTIERFVY